MPINYSLGAVLDTAAVLATINPVLQEDQLGKEVDTGRFKIGDGILAWNLLEYSDTNGNMTVFMGPSTDPGNLVQASPLDGGVALTKEALDFSVVVDQALAGSLTLADRPNFLSTDRHKTAAMILGVFLRRVISAMGSNFSAVISNPGYSGPTIQASLASLQAAIDSLSGTTGGLINDVGTSATNSWSSQKTASEIQTAVQALRTQLVGSAGEALDTIYELGEALQSNVGFITTITDELGKTIKYTVQSLTNEQKEQARTNIGAVGTAGLVLTSAQTLTDPQKAQARTNIGAAVEAELVRVVAQTLTEPQKVQARTNIGAVSADAVQMKNAGIVTGNNPTVTNESDRLAGSIQVLSHSRYGGVQDNGRGFLIGCGTVASGNPQLKIFRSIGDAVYEETSMLTLGGDDDFARIYGKKVLTEDNIVTVSNKTFVRPREQRTSLTDAVNVIDLRTCGSFVTMRPNNTITLATDALGTTTDEGRSVVVYFSPTGAVTFTANTAVKWPGDIIPTLAANKITPVHFQMVNIPGQIAAWLAVAGATWL